jgi:hypothetical protein
MWFELGHPLVWDIHGYECSGGAFGSVCIGQMKEAVGPGQTICADHLDYTVPLLRRPQFPILILCTFHALCHVT